MPRYYDCPHEYVVSDSELLCVGAPWGISDSRFNYLKRMIETYGKRRKWRTRNDIALYDGAYVYWATFGCINRTGKESSLFDGYPPPEVLDKLRKRFWPNTEERRAERKILDDLGYMD